MQLNSVDRVFIAKSNFQGKAVASDLVKIQFFLLIILEFLPMFQAQMPKCFCQTHYRMKKSANVLFELWLEDDVAANSGCTHFVDMSTILVAPENVYSDPSDMKCWNKTRS